MIKNQEIEAYRLPHPEDEDWRLTPLSRLYQNAELKGSNRHAAVPPGLAELEPYLHPGCDHLVVVDGRFAPELSPTTGQLIRTTEIKTAIPGSRSDFGAYTIEAGAPYTAVAIDRHALSRPLQILLVDSGGAEMTRHSRLGLEVAAGARVELIETRVALSRDPQSNSHHWRNHLFELSIGAGAELRSYHEFGPEAGLHPFDTHGIIARLEDRAVWRATKVLCANPTMDSGQGFIRHDLSVLLGGAEANFALDAVMSSGAAHKVILATQIQHLVPNGHSQQAIKIIARDESDAVMQGLILVHPDAQKTQAHLLARGMVLSPQPEARSRAQINLKPELKIYADDVKCSHGATVGEMDREALFYLTSRGLPLSVAREILTAAFVSSALESLESFSESSIAAAAQKLLLGGGFHD